jgi:hypothetical protein
MPDWEDFFREVSGDQTGYLIAVLFSCTERPKRIINAVGSENGEQIDGFVILDSF